MLKSVLVFVFLLNLFSNSYINGATFENIDGTLVERNRNYLINHTTLDFRKPSFTIKSDDSLAPYTKNRGNYTVIRIEIEHQNIPKLPVKSIDDLGIYGLSITDCNLQEIEPGAFGVVPMLETLDLSFNKLIIIKKGVFTTELNIKNLYLANNSISTIEDNAFANSKLETIWLDNNKISIWNSGWFTYSHIKSLHMTGNLIQELPLNAFDFENVGEYDRYDIDFENNQIKTIQPGAFNGVGSIHLINLKSNQIEELAAGVFKGITKIIFSLHLENNTISKIDEQMFGDVVEFIHEVSLQHNKLSEVPWNFLKNKKIKSVMLQNNPLKCSFVEEVEAWTKSKAGDFHGYPIDYWHLKKSCV